MCILFVLYPHLDFTLNHYMAHLAVNGFFVLSGFLITTLLIAEYNQFQTISLKNFYYRRALRLFPALFVMIFLFAIYAICFGAASQLHRNFYFITQALFYFANWAQVFGLGERWNYIAHTWSLSMEEQFYLLWPIILLFMLRKTASRTSLLWWTMLAMFFFVGDRIFMVVWDEPFWSNFWRLSRSLDTRADSLLAGCCAGIAIASGLLPVKRGFQTGLKFASAASVIGLLVIGQGYAPDPWKYCLEWFLASAFTAVVILQLVLTSKTALHRVMEWPPLVYVGKISYGLYVWHYPIFEIARNNIHSFHWQIVAIPVAIAATLVSYYFLELPCLRLKKRFQKVGKNSGTPTISNLPAQPALETPT